MQPTFGRALGGRLSLPLQMMECLVGVPDLDRIQAHQIVCHHFPPILSQYAKFSLSYQNNRLIFIFRVEYPRNLQIATITSSPRKAAPPLP